MNSLKREQVPHLAQIHIKRILRLTIPQWLVRLLESAYFSSVTTALSAYFDFPDYSFLLAQLPLTPITAITHERSGEGGLEVVVGVLSVKLWVRFLTPLKTYSKANVHYIRKNSKYPRHREKEEDFGKRNMPGKRARRHFSRLSEFERDLITGMKTAGWSTRRVAGQVDRSECAVRNCWEQWTREGTHVRKTGSGATKKTTRREDQRIVRQALVDPTVTRSTMRADVGVAIVPQTISRHLAEANLKSKRPFRALPLTPEHRQLRLQWCQARSMWNVPDWQKVEFSDESRFVLGKDDNRVRVWRRPAYDSRSTLIVVRGTLTGQRYADDILRPHVGSFLNGLPGAIFQQDNARPHTARVAQDFLRHFQTLPWPSHSPDLSPVVHVWDQLKRQMPSCHSVHDLELAVQDL
ncbi:transposable element Tcb1 transposase [Trichonephila clavipes]|uniref:Transposable element Tcb1 transposase n=1 Tax=Trichonephila clavipes TaxID=2585209 RepID=A0A8X6T0B6_TRICX|nr:transposable element Tcb1 transposase [Trichonephila clavipes]